MPYTSAERQRAYYRKHWKSDYGIRTLTRKRKRYAELRQAVIAKLGNKCIRCGFADFRALQIDHIDGNGYKERKRIVANAPGWYRRILVDPSGYQVLCANCNWIKRYENREGPQPIRTPTGP